MVIQELQLEYLDDFYLLFEDFVKRQEKNKKENNDCLIKN